MIALADLEGCWRRLWLRAPGLEDRETRVLWRQGARDFVDLRIPADLPDMGGAASLAELDAAALSALARCEGFAGTTEVEDGVCVWTREINFRGPQTGPDVGALEMAAEGLIETGVHADYSELWTLAEAGPVETRTLRDAAGRLLVLAAGPEGFSLGRADPAAASGTALADALAAALAANDRSALRALFAQEFCCGAFDGDVARIDASTDPTRIGVAAFLRGDLGRAAPRLVEKGFDGAERATLWF